MNFRPRYSLRVLFGTLALALMGGCGSDSTAIPTAPALPSVPTPTPAVPAPSNANKICLLIATRDLTVASQASALISSAQPRLAGFDSIAYMMSDLGFDGNRESIIGSCDQPFYAATATKNFYTNVTELPNRSATMEVLAELPFDSDASKAISVDTISQVLLSIRIDTLHTVPNELPGVTTSYWVRGNDMSRSGKVTTPNDGLYFKTSFDANGISGTRVDNGVQVTLIRSFRYKADGKFSLGGSGIGIKTFVNDLWTNGSTYVRYDGPAPKVDFEIKAFDSKSAAVSASLALGIRPAFAP